MTFKLAASPHTHSRRTTQQVMRWVYLALLPGVLLQTYFFGVGVYVQILLALATAWLAEAAVMRYATVRSRTLGKTIQPSLRPSC